MKIIIKGNDIEIRVSDEAIYGMGWEEMRQLEEAFRIIREIQKTTKIQNIELTV